MLMCLEVKFSWVNSSTIPYKLNVHSKLFILSKSLFAHLQNETKKTAWNVSFQNKLKEREREEKEQKANIFIKQYIQFLRKAKKSSPHPTFLSQAQSQQGVPRQF